MSKLGREGSQELLRIFIGSLSLCNDVRVTFATVSLPRNSVRVVDPPAGILHSDTPVLPSPRWMPGPVFAVASSLTEIAACLPATDRFPLGSNSFLRVSPSFGVIVPIWTTKWNC